MQERKKKGRKAKYILHEGIALASPSHRVFVEIYELQFSKRLENLLDITLRKVKVE